MSAITSISKLEEIFNITDDELMVDEQGNNAIMIIINRMIDIPIQVEDEDDPEDKHGDAFYELYKIAMYLIHKSSTDALIIRNKKGFDVYTLSLQLYRYVLKHWVGAVNNWCDVIIHAVELKLNIPFSARDEEEIIEKYNKVMEEIHKYIPKE
jgi:hypothetical protein